MGKWIKLKKIQPSDPDLGKISVINNEAFPPSERMSIEEMLSFSNQSDTDILGIYDGKTLAGFSMTIKNEACVYVYFLAIDNSMRGKQYGSRAIKSILRAYRGKQVVLDFEQLDPSADNYRQRVRRKNFYLKNGFHETGRYTILRGDMFEVVCSSEELDTDAFSDILKKINALLPVFSEKLI